MSEMYIHYGADTFSKEILIRNVKEKAFRRRDKPAGLWASPVDAELGWHEWCENEEWNTENLNKSFRFTLKPEARVLRLEKLVDVTNYILVDHENSIFLTYYILDLKKIYKNFDAMELCISKDYSNFHDNNIFYTWDVDSIVIWNPDVIILS